ncbi:MAG: thiamine phosphate synthase [Bacteroidetes bacterium]|nr:thiamine phosphate synthase [Bacteroidota bacterium]
MDLYLITAPQTHKDEIVLVRQFLEQGLQRLHIRKPGYGEQEFAAYVSSIPALYHDRLVIHGPAALLRQFPWTGFHLRSDERTQPALMQSFLQQRPASLSSSFHAWQELREETTFFDHAFISPVFDSISKQGYKAAIDMTELSRLRAWAASAGRQLPRIVALGGVDAAGIPLLKAHGFDGAALLGAIWEAADPVAAFAAIQAACRQAG